MKNFYISPELQIFCFVPIERLALENLSQGLNIVRISSYNNSTLANEMPEASYEEGDITLPTKPRN